MSERSSTPPQQYVCPDCGHLGAHPTNLPAPKCDRCNYAVVMVPAQKPKQIIDPPGAAVEMFRRKHGRLPNRPGDHLSLADRLELAAQACHAAHLLSCEITCREAIVALSETTSITKERDEAIIKRDALHLVVSVLAGKLMLENAVLIDMLKQAEEELRAKRWLS